MNGRALPEDVEPRPLRPQLWAAVLLAFVPGSVAVDLLVGAGVATFLAAGVAIVPLAWFLGLATEEIGKHTGPGIGGLLNATFGNATELIIALFALAGGLYDVVKASLTGSILGNLLLVLGLSMLAGGIRHRTQTFSREASGIHVSMLILAVIGMVMPALYRVTAGASPDPSVIGDMSLGIAGILIVAYGFGLLFSLRTHRDLFNPVTRELESPRWSLRASLGILLGATVLVALESELLVGSLTVARDALGLRDLFVGVVIIAVIGNAAEHGGAVLMARRDKMDLSLAITMTSTTQIALFVAPVLVLASLSTAQLLTLDFEPFELLSVALAVAALSSVVSDGRSNWYEGFLLTMVYAILVMAFYFHP